MRRKARGKGTQALIALPTHRRCSGSLICKLIHLVPPRLGTSTCVPPPALEFEEVVLLEVAFCGSERNPLRMVDKILSPSVFMVLDSAISLAALFWTRVKVGHTCLVRISSPIDRYRYPLNLCPLCVIYSLSRHYRHSDHLSPYQAPNVVVV